MERSHTFDNFFVHEGNEVALLAAKKIVESPGELFNPFYVFGSKGAGKTHLLHAINSELSKKCTTIFMPVKIFEKSILESMAFTSPLIVDDLHKISDDCKEKLLDIVERALDDNIQLCFSANVAPGEIKNLDGKICSYIKSGLVCDLRSPEESARIEIIKKKADEAGIILSEDVAEELAPIATGSIGIIESMINRLVAYSSLGNMAIDSNSIKMILQEFYPKKQAKAVSSVLEDMKRGEIWLSDIDAVNLRAEFEKRKNLWEMRGIDVSPLEEQLQESSSDLQSAYRDFVERVKKLIELQIAFRTVDREKHPLETMNAEAMLLNPQKIDELEELLSDLGPSVEGSEKSDDAPEVLPETEEHDEIVVPLGLPGEDASKPPESTEQQEGGESVEYHKVVPLSDSLPVDTTNTKNYLMPDTLGELTEERF
jgi:Holliday junction resolvasome RuvABC ATP-dependent DNA helicase subunit